MGAFSPRQIPLPPSAAVLLFVGLLMAACGCTPRVIVRGNPAPCDEGIRYYRPKPYLKIEPAEVAVDKNQTALVPEMVRISLVYLPDFSEEYAIEVRSGLGTADVGIKLEDGWNLTEISQDLDSQTDENLEAIGSLIGAVGEVVPSSAENLPSKDISFTVPSRNVPIGFYESVIGRDSRGCKRLYGFRYLGFLPYSSCPVDMSGHQHAHCGDAFQPLYGLIYTSGRMVFQPLELIGTTPVDSASKDELQRSSTPTPTADSPSQPPGPADLQRLPIDLRTHLLQIHSDVGEVRAGKSGGVVVVRIEVPSDTPVMPIRQAAEDWLTRSFGPAARFDVQIEATGRGRELTPFD